MISTIDPDARHGHKTSARGFDGYKGHALVDPDSELIVATTATAGNVGDAAAAPELLAELVDQVHGEQPAAADPDDGPPSPQPAAYGDSAYGTGPLLERLHAAGIDPLVKVQAPVAPKGHFTKEQFHIDLAAGTITCPAKHAAPIVYNPNPGHRHHGQASFGPACASCPLRGQCTSAAGAAPSPSPPTRLSWRLRAPARPTLTWPPTTARPDPRWSASWPIWSAAATAAAACGSAAWPRSPPTSTCWPPRSTWPGWACSACTGAHRTAGWQHEPTRLATSGSRAAGRPARHPHPAGQPTPLTPRHCNRRHPQPLHSLISMARFTPAT